MVYSSTGNSGAGEMRDIIGHKSGVLHLIAASLVFALWNTAYKYAVDALPLSTALPVMLLTAAAALWTITLIKGRQRLARSQLRRTAVAGLIDPALSYTAIGVGLAHIDATVSAMLGGTEACFVVAFGAIVARRAPGYRAVLGVLLSAAGVAALGGTRSMPSLWELLVLAGVACAGLCNVLSERVLGDDVDPLTMTACQLGVAALCTLPLLAWQWRAGLPAAHRGAWAAAIACGIALAAGFLLYNYAIVRVPVTTAGMVLNTIPVFGVAAAITFLGERITWVQAAGAAVVLVAFFLFEEGKEHAEGRHRRRPFPSGRDEYAHRPPKMSRGKAPAASTARVIALPIRTTSSVRSSPRYCQGAAASRSVWSSTSARSSCPAGVSAPSPSSRPRSASPLTALSHSSWLQPRLDRAKAGLNPFAVATCVTSASMPLSPAPASAQM